MLSTKEETQEAELIFKTYLGLPERERTMVLAYTTAIRDKTLADEQARQQSEHEPRMPVLERR